ncbi:hypothetical protein E2C01_016880 [Portunus trituberculatus]|uniref:Uncharacterized protein n=1 Tax=Portunus trituberculatus TaxID=210409 RepID=A0A5B7DRE6_PORTR|nr:hypothetical protein [Portunus trituberculatus]
MVTHPLVTSLLLPSSSKLSITSLHLQAEVLFPSDVSQHDDFQLGPIKVILKDMYDVCFLKEIDLL